MSRVRVIIAVGLIAALALVGWQVFLRPRSTGATNAAPAFSATLHGQKLSVKFPDAYAGKWIWLMFSGKD